MNPVGPFEGAFSDYCYQLPMPSLDGDAVRMRGSGWMPSGTAYSLGGVPVASPHGAATSTVSVTSAATATVGSNFTVTYTGSNVSFDPVAIAMAGYGQPAPEPLEVRRFYHWNKPPTAGDTGRPGAAQKEDVARTRLIAAGIAADAHNTIQVTESAAVQAVNEDGGQALERARRRRLVRRTVISPRSLTSVAVILAGQKRSMVGEEWRGHLLGERASGLTRREEARAARGFVLAAMRYRAHDAADLVWRPADAVLRSRTKSNLFVWLPVLGIVLAVVHHDGWYGLAVNAQNLIETWIGLYAAVRVGRWYRKVKPPEPKPRRAGMATAGEDGQEDTPKG